MKKTTLILLMLAGCIQPEKTDKVKWFVGNPNDSTIYVRDLVKGTILVQTKHKFGKDAVFLPHSNENSTILISGDTMRVIRHLIDNYCTHRK